MNKFVTLMILVAFLFTVSYLATSLGFSVNQDIGAIESSFELGSISGIIDVLSTFFNIMLFRVEGIPVLITIIVFYPITFGIIYMIVDIAKDLIPFT
jgi:hypothetical protein